MPSVVKFFAVQTITFLNLSLGVLAILSSNIKIAAIFIIIAAFLDRVDGKIARKLNVESSLGKELDSLSDLISFGVAPAAAAWKTSLNILGFWGYVPVLIFIIAGAFRLARYNITDFSGHFIGMPITLAGFISAVAVFFQLGSTILASLMLLLSFLMVSNLKLKKV